MYSSSLKTLIYLMGPTASGKTPLAIELVQHFPGEIVSVDSAMIYKQMNIGTAKPSSEQLKIAPHRLIDILDPKEIYSAGHFCNDAIRESEDILATGKIPLLVGGTMLYFRVLQQGLAKLPPADSHIREQLLARAEAEGWSALHAWLMQVDPTVAKRININDKQRIQRALEVYLITGTPLSVWQNASTEPLAGYKILPLILMPEDRALLHQRIALRFKNMLAEGLIEEVLQLYKRGDLSPTLPAIRSVGYRQVWSYLAGEINYDDMCEQAIAATRQLAKRQITWLRSWENGIYFPSEAKNLLKLVMTQLGFL